MALSSTLQFRRTGAASHGAAQTEPDASLGGFMASQEVLSLKWLVFDPISNLRVDNASGNNGPGLGSLLALDADRVAFQAPRGASLGTPVTIADGETKYLYDGDDTDRWVQVSRTSTEDLQGSMGVLFTEVCENEVAGNRWTTAEQASGQSQYRCIGLLASGAGLTNLKFWLNPLGSEAALTAGYAASGAITLEMDDLSDWPKYPSYAVKNETTGEVMLVASVDRSANQVTVAAAGRDLWGDVAGGALGTIADVIVPLSPVRLARSRPWLSTTEGKAQVIVDENTSPKFGFGNCPFGTFAFGHGVTFFRHAHGAAEAGVLLYPSLSGSAIYYLWIEAKIPAGATASPTILVNLAFSYDTGISGELRGRTRLPDGALPAYLLFHAVDSDPDPDTDSEEETFDSLPHTMSAALTVSHQHRILVLGQNEYGLRSKNRSPWRVTLAADGSEVAAPPSDPTDIRVTPAASGAVRLRARYKQVLDLAAHQADAWKVWWTTDGSNPDPTDPPSLEQSMAFISGQADLDYTTGALADGLTFQAIIRASRTAEAGDTDSEDETIYSTTTETDGPATPDPAGAFSGRLNAEV